MFQTFLKCGEGGRDVGLWGHVRVNGLEASATETGRQRMRVNGREGKGIDHGQGLEDEVSKKVQLVMANSSG